MLVWNDAASNPWLLSGWDREEIQRKTHINALELLAIVAVVWTVGKEFLQNREVVFFCDNTSDMSAAVHGYARSPDLAALSNTLHLVLAALKYTPFFQWVPSLANCADIPTRPQGVILRTCKSHALARKNEVSLFRKSSISWSEFHFQTVNRQLFSYIRIIVRWFPKLFHNKKKKQENCLLCDFQMFLKSQENLQRVNAICGSVLTMCSICGKALVFFVFDILPVTSTYRIPRYHRDHSHSPPLRSSNQLQRGVDRKWMYVVTHLGFK